MAHALAGKWIWVWNWWLVAVGAPVERLEPELTARSNGSASPPPAQRTYTVKSGNTLSGIAQKLGLARLAEPGRGKRRRHRRRPEQDPPGQELVLP